MTNPNPYSAELVDDVSRPWSSAAIVMSLGYLGTVFVSIPGFLWMGSNQGTPILSMGIGSFCTLIVGAPLFIAAAWIFARVPIRQARLVASVAGGLTGLVLFLIMLVLDYSTAIPPKALPLLVPPTILGALGPLFFAGAQLPYDQVAKTQNSSSSLTRDGREVGDHE